VESFILQAGSPYRRGRLSAADFLIKIACFVKNIFLVLRVTDFTEGECSVLLVLQKKLVLRVAYLNSFVQGGQPYLSFPCNKDSMLQKQFYKIGSKLVRCWLMSLNER
jgi:hypothetical protein